MVYYIEIDGGQGGYTRHKTDDIDDAVSFARDWCQAGDWDTSQGVVYCDVRVTEERSKVEDAQAALDAWESQDQVEIADVFDAIFERLPIEDEDAVGLIHSSRDVLTEEQADRVLAVLDAPDAEERVVTVSIEPEEPECVDGADHDWRTPHSVLGGSQENPGVWCNGGGVIMRECCAHCGRYRVTDTWAQRHDTGEQGLTEVTYDEADEASKAWLYRRSSPEA